MLTKAFSLEELAKANVVWVGRTRHSFKVSTSHTYFVGEGTILIDANM